MVDKWFGNVPGKRPSEGEGSDQADEFLRALATGQSHAQSEPAAEIIAGAKAAGDWLKELEKNGLTRMEAYSIVLQMFNRHGH